MPPPSHKHHTHTSAHAPCSLLHLLPKGSLATCPARVQIAAGGQHNAAVTGAALPLALRRSLPWGHLYRTSGLHGPTAGDDAPSTSSAPDGQGHAKPGKAGSKSTVGEGGDFGKAAAATAAAAAAGLRAFADQLEAKPHALVNQAANAAFTQFICRRLPPHPKQLHPKGGGALEPCRLAQVLAGCQDRLLGFLSGMEEFMTDVWELWNLTGRCLQCTAHARTGDRNAQALQARRVYAHSRPGHCPQWSGRAVHTSSSACLLGEEGSKPSTHQVWAFMTPSSEVIPTGPATRL